MRFASTSSALLLAVSSLMTANAREHQNIARSLASLTSTSAKSLPTLPACIATCVGASLAAGGCTNITDLDCTCTSETFKTASNACIKKQCSTTDATAAKIIEDAECAAISASNSSSSSSSASGSTATSSSPASALALGDNGALRAAVLTAGVGLVGAISAFGLLV